MMAVILAAVMVLGGTSVTAMGEVSGGMAGENAVLEDTPAVNSVTGPAILLGVSLPDYQINEDDYNWTSGEQTVTLNGNDTFTILNAPPVDAKISIDVASVSGSSITIVGDASTTYNNVCINVKRDINLTLDNLKIVAPDTFGGLFSYPALLWNSSGGAATLTISGQCSLSGSMFGSGIQSIGSQQLTIIGNGGGDDRLIAQGGSYTIPEINKGQTMGSGISMLNVTSGTARLAIEEVIVEATGGKDMGSFGVGGSGISVTNGNMDIVDAAVTAASGTDSNATAVMTAIGAGDISITNSSVTAIGADNASAAGDTGISAAKVTINSGTVVSQAGDSISAKGGTALSIGALLQIAGGTVTVTGGDSYSEEGGRAITIWPGTLQISGGTVTAAGGKSVNQSGGVAVYTGTLQISGGTVTAAGGNGMGNGGHGFFVASGRATLETGANFTTVGGNGTTGVGGVGLRAYGYNGGDNTVTIANSAGDIYIRGGQGVTEQRASVMGGIVYIGTGNVGNVIEETGVSGFHIKNAPGRDDVHKISVSTIPAAEVTIRCVVGGGTPSEYTYRSKADQSGTAYLWLPAGGQVLKADSYSDTNTTVVANDTNTAVLSGQPVVTAHDSAELQTYMAASYITTINLVSGATYKYPGGTVSRDLTINGNNAVIEAGTGVNDTMIRSDDVTVDSSALANYTGVKTFLKVEGTGSALKLKDVVLRNGIQKNGADNKDDGIFTVINVKTGGSLSMDGVTLEGFHNNPAPGDNLSFGIHAEPGAVSTVIENCRFDSSNAFRNAVAIRKGAMQISNNAFEGTDYPERLRQSDGYEYAIYIYGGNGTVAQNTITGYDSTTQLGYASAGIAVIGFYSTEVTIENNVLSYNESGIDITGTWTPYSINTNMKVNGQLLASSEDAYAIGEVLKAANTQEYVSASLNQNDEVQLTNSSGGKYFAVLGGYRSPWINVTGTEENTVSVWFPAADIDTLNAADLIEFEVQTDGGTNWTAVTPIWVQEPAEAKLTLTEGHEYSIRAKLTHTSYVDAGDPTTRTLITYSNPITVTPTTFSVSETGTVTFDELTEGYSVADRDTVTKTITLTKQGTGAITGLTVTLSGGDDTKFLLGIVQPGALGAETQSTNFLIRPKTGLAAGTYTETVTISATDQSTKTFDVSFTVNAASVTPAAPNVTANDTTNQLEGATAVMEYSTDGGSTWTSYNPDNAPAFTGDRTVKVRVKAEGSNPAGEITTVNFTANVITPTPTPDQAPAPVPAPVPAPTPSVEKITVEVKQGNTESTVSQITIERTTDANGRKSDKVTYEEQKAVETIERLKKEKKDTARIVIPDEKKEVSETIVNIPNNSLNLLAEGQISLQIDTEKAKIDIPMGSLQKAGELMEQDMYFNLVPIEEEVQKEEVEERVILQVGVINGNASGTISIVGNPITIETNMPSSEVDITLPLTGIEILADPEARETFLNQLAVFIEHSDGEKELVQGEIVEYRPGVPGIKFHIMKFSTFTIVKVEKSSACDVIKVTVPAKATIKGSKITATVDNATKNLTVNVTVSDKASWKLYSDKACSRELKDRKLTLKVGANTVYLKTTAEDGRTSKVYTVTITRRELPKQLIIIANKYDFADAFVGGVPALQSGGEVITAGIAPADAKRLVSYIKKNYTKQDKIYILGLEKAVNKDLEKLLKKEGYSDVVRIGGKDKYETARKTAEIVKLSEKVRVVLVNGTVKPQDAESIQKICAEKGYPILLVQKDNLTSSTLEALKEIKPARVYILGDQTKISSKVADQVSKELKLKNSNIIRIKSGKEIK
jgi:putative cell wall-binding protein